MALQWHCMALHGSAMALHGSAWLCNGTSKPRKATQSNRKATQSNRKATQGDAKRTNTMRDYRNLEVWQSGRQFAVLCYRVTSQFPKEELYGLTSQIRRAATSV